MRTSYYITPTRLVKSQHFWKTLQLMRTVNADLFVLLPRPTQDWLFTNDNWATISPGNAAMCLPFFARGPYEYRWTNVPEAAQAIFKHIVDHRITELYGMVVSSSLLEEERLTYFIEVVIPTLNRGEVSVTLSKILRNVSLKRYQYELAWEVTDGIKHPAFLEWPLNNIPDYIFASLVEEYLFKDQRAHYVYSDTVVGLLREAVRRGIIVSKKVPVVVASEPRPTKSRSITTEVPRELKRLLPGKVYKL